MARTDITPQTSSAREGLVIAWEAANADGNAVTNNGDRRVLVRSSASADRTVTQVTGGTVNGLDVADPTVTVPAGETVQLGPWPPVYDQPDERSVHLDYDDATSLEVAAIEG